MKDEANPFSLFSFFLGLIFFGLGNALAVKVKFLGFTSLGSFKYGSLPKIWMDHWYLGVICGLCLVLISLLVDRKYINVGTFLNALLIGPIMDFFLQSNILPNASDYLWINLLILFSGIAITGIGGGMYVAAGIGAGPRDGFMLTISDKTGLSISRARIIVECVVLVIGFMLGGPVFIVTFLYTFIQSPIFQQSFKMFQTLLHTLHNKEKVSEHI